MRTGGRSSTPTMGAGWIGLPQHWGLKDGVLTGSNLPNGLPFRTFLCSEKRYRDFEIRFQVRVRGPSGPNGGNSGLNVRSEVLDRNRMTVTGVQADIGGDVWGAASSEFIQGGINTHPAWSPDGKRIAFEHHDDVDQPGSLYIMDADGGNQKRIILRQGPVDGGRPAWRPKPPQNEQR